MEIAVDDIARPLRPTLYMRVHFWYFTPTRFPVPGVNSQTIRALFRRLSIRGQLYGELARIPFLDR